MSYLAFSLFGDWAGVAKEAGWIGALFGFLAWGVMHYANLLTVGGILGLLILFVNVGILKRVSADGFFGKVGIVVCSFLIVAGVSWRIADGVIEKMHKGSSPQQTQQQAHPTPEQQGTQGPDKPAEFTPNGG